MSLTDWVMKKATALKEVVIGKEIANYGDLSTNPSGHVVSSSLLLWKNGNHFLVFTSKSKSSLQVENLEIELNLDVLERMDFILADARKNIAGKLAQHGGSAEATAGENNPLPPR